eukprot:11735811-Prorocentrum_lima.AAC.1
MSWPPSWGLQRRRDHGQWWATIFTGCFAQTNGFSKTSGRTCTAQSTLPKATQHQSFKHAGRRLEADYSR